MKKILLTIAMLGVALASTASAHPHGGCYQPGATRTGGTRPIAAKTVMIATIPPIRIIAIR